MVIQSTISNSAYYNSKEQVDAINDSKERVDFISDSDKLVDAVIEAKSYRDYSFKMSLKLWRFLSGKIIRIVESILIIESILWFDQLLIFHWHDERELFHWHDEQKIFYWHNQYISSYSHDQRKFQRKMKMSTYQTTWTQNHHHQTRHQRKRNAIRRKSIVNTGKMTRQTHHRATILIRPMTVITEASDAKRRAIRKRIPSNYAQL